MKINIPTAVEQRKKRAKVVNKKTEGVATMAKKFLNGPVKEAIEEAEFDCVNVEIPVEAYENLDLFYTLCFNELRRLGYSCVQSHDGGGMYNTLFVSWEEATKA